MSGSDADSSVSEDSQPRMDIDYPLNTPTAVPNTDEGLVKTVLTEGTGSRPVKGAKVTVHYVGTLEDGTPFDSSRDRGEFFEFTLGKGQVIKGWDKGVATMRIGEKAILKCSSDYAYGPTGSPPKIPPNATLLFEVELFDWSREVDISKAKDRSLLKSLIVDGIDYENPSFESDLVMDLSIYLGPVTPEDVATMTPVFAKKSWAIQIGEAALPPMLEKCLESMRKQETAVFRVKGELIPNEGVPAFSIPSAAERGEEKRDVSYLVEIHELHTVKTYDFSGFEKVKEGAARKDKGNAHFKAGELDLAEKWYSRALEFIGEDYGYGKEETVECHKVRIATLGNLSQVLLMKKRYADVVVNCDKILALDGANAKALFRVAKALDGLQEWDSATQAVDRLLAVEPANADALALKTSIRASQKAFDAKQKSVFKKMFS